MRLRKGLSSPTTPTTRKFLEWYNALRSPIRRSESIRRLPLDKRTIGSLWMEMHHSQTEEEWNALLVEPDLDSDLRHEIIRYGEFAEACYDNFDITLPSNYNGQCKYPQTEFLEMAGLGKSGYEITRYLYGVSSDPMGLLERMSSWVGFVAVSNSPELVAKLGRRDILVAWRGTQLPMEWIANIRDFLVPFPSPKEDNDDDATAKGDGALMVPNNNIKVEDGFLSMYLSRMEDDTGGFNAKSSAREQLLSEVHRLLSNYLEKGEAIGITLTGHSLGGALALLASYDLGQLKQQYSSLMVTVITFASPRVGNLGFKKEMEKLGVKAIRVVNENDMVPRIPGVILNENMGMSRLLDWLPWTYFHVGVSIKLDNRDSPFLDKYKTFDLSCTHNLEVYLHLLDGYTASTEHQQRQKEQVQEQEQEQERKCNVSAFQWRGRDPALVNKRCDMLVQRLGIPAYWWQDRNKGLSKNSKGRWVLPPLTNKEEEKEAEDRISRALSKFENDKVRHPRSFPSPILGVPWSIILAYTFWWAKLFIRSLLPRSRHNA